MLHTKLSKAKKSYDKKLKKTQPKTVAPQFRLQSGNANTSKRAPKEKKKRWQKENKKEFNFSASTTRSNMTIGSGKKKKKLN